MNQQQIDEIRAEWEHAMGRHTVNRLCDALDEAQSEVQAAHAMHAEVQASFSNMQNRIAKQDEMIARLETDLAEQEREADMFSLHWEDAEAENERLMVAFDTMQDRIAALEAENERMRGNDVEWTDEVLADVLAIEEKHGIELVSIDYCERLYDYFQEEHEKNERLRAALRDVSEEHIVEDADPNWWCRLCGTVLSEDKRGHADDCPFKILDD